MCKLSDNTSKKESQATSKPESAAVVNERTIEEIRPKKESDSLSNGASTTKSIATADPSMTSENSARRRHKRDKYQEWSIHRLSIAGSSSSKRIVKKKKKSSMTAKHQNDSKSGGIDALIPSFIGVIVLGIAIMAKMGFRGRSTVAGIDLGTTNSVICVQAQEKGGAS